jgi:hypothetical protein
MSGDEEALSDRGTPGAVRRVVPAVVRRRFALKFGLVLLVMAISIAGIGLAATDKISAQTADNVENEYRSVAETEMSIIERWLRRNRLSAKYISQIPTLRENSLSTRQTLSDERYELGENAFSLHLVNRSEDGTVTVVSSTRDMDPGTALGDGPRAWVPQRLGSGTNLADSAVVLNETYAVGDRSVVGFLSPVANANGRYLVVEMTVRGITDKF